MMRGVKCIQNPRDHFAGSLEEEQRKGKSLSAPVRHSVARAGIWNGMDTYTTGERE